MKLPRAREEANFECEWGERAGRREGGAFAIGSILRQPKGPEEKGKGEGDVSFKSWARRHHN